MVYLLVRDPLVAVAVDCLVAAEAATESHQQNSTAVSSSPSSSTPSAGPLAECREQFVRDSITTTLSVMTPSVALDSLWVLLHLKRQFVLAQLQSTSDSSGDVAGADARFSDCVLPCSDVLGYLDHLLIHERGAVPQEDAKDSENADGTHSDEKETGTDSSSLRARDVHSAIAVLDLALDVLSSQPSSSAPRRAPSVLLQPATLSLLIRDLEMLWCWKYLLRHVHLRQLAKRGLLTREGDAEATPSREKPARTRSAMRGTEARARNVTCARQAVNRLPLDEFFHDYELLLPLSVMATFAAARATATATTTTTTAVTDAKSLDHIRAWVVAIVSEASSPGVHDARLACHAKAKQLQNRPGYGEKHVSQRQDALTTEAKAEAVVLSVITAPATSPENNPHRALKNKRVDVIDAAAMSYFYKQLASRTGRGAVGNGGNDALGPTGAPQRIIVKGNSDVLDEAQLAQNDVAFGRRERGEAETAESFASFLRSTSVGLDIHLMSLTGAGVGYYIAHVRGRSTETCILYAVIGLVVMLFVDATLLIIRLGRHDEGVAKQKQKAAKARARLSVEQVRHAEAARGLEAKLATAAKGEAVRQEDDKLKKD